MNDVLDRIDMFVVDEMNKATFEKQINRAKRDKKRLKGLQTTIVDMGHGGMLSSKDVSDLTSQIKSYL